MQKQLMTYQKILFVLVFAVIGITCFVGTFLDWDFYGMQGENRRLADFPSPEGMTAKQWELAYDKWYNDHFGFRNTFVKAHSEWRHMIGREGRVLKGMDGWLFLNDDIVIKDFLGYRQPKEEGLEQRFANLESRIHAFETAGINYLFVLVPNKATVYPDYLPLAIQDGAGRTDRQIMLAYLKKHAANGSRVMNHFLDLTPVLRDESKMQRKLYYPTDTHWNTWGARLGEKAIVSRLRLRMPKMLKPLGNDAFDIEAKKFVGDLARMTGLAERHEIEVSDQAHKESESWEIRQIEDPYFIEHGIKTIHNAQGQYDVVIFHDSFANTLKQFLPAYFRNTTFVWQYANPENVKAILPHTAPDLVIEQSAQRFFVKEGSGPLLTALEVHDVKQSVEQRPGD